MECKTIGNKSPVGLQKVFVASERKSSEAKSFIDELVKILFKHFNCAVYYSPDDNIDDLQENIPMMDVVIFILTEEMLHKGNVNIDAILPLCNDQKIPVIPLLMNTEQESLYSRIFYEMQYLCPNDHDYTRIPFERKLVDRLSSILIHDDMLARIGTVFPKMLFLSYRKKNRNLANELMHKIHSNKLFVNVAVWYDERIVTGESFRTEIENAIKKVDGFVLLVTDEVIETPNYVHDVEIKIATSLKHLTGKIVAVKCEDKQIGKEFYEKFSSISKVYSYDKEDFFERLSDLVGTEAVDDADSLYYLGLAYQKGIYVEMNPGFAVELLTESADKGNRSAINRLVYTFVEGIGVEKSYEAAVKWENKLICCIPDNQLSLEYKRLAEIYEKRHDWDAAICCYNKALETASENYEYEDEIVTSIIRIGLLKNNNEGYENALDICLKSLQSLSAKIEIRNERTVSSLSLILFETVSILFKLSESKQFAKKVELISKIIYNIRYRISALYPDLNITEFLHDSAFYDSSSKTTLNFINEANIIPKGTKDSPFSLNDISFQYTDNGMLAEEISYIVLKLEMMHLGDLPSCYKRIIEVFTDTINYYIKKGMFYYAHRNIALAEKILSEASEKWYLDTHEEILNLMLIKTELYFRSKDKRANEEMNRLFEMIEENLSPSQYLSYINTIDKCISFVPDDSLAFALLRKQESILRQISDGFYFDTEVDKWRLRCAVNLFQASINAGDKNTYYYYNQATKLCQKLMEDEESFVIEAVQRLYLARLHYLLPKSPEQIGSANQIVEALLDNTSVMLENKVDIDSILRSVLVEVDRYISYLCTYFPAYAPALKTIVRQRIENCFIPYVNSIMVSDPRQFLPPSYRHSYTDFALLTGMDSEFVDSFRSLYFILHMFIICNMDDHDEKKDAIDEVISMYDKAIDNADQGYCLQTLVNEKNIILAYRNEQN